MRGLRFLLKGDLIYYWSKTDGTERLCILKALTPEIFREAHDGFFYQGLNRVYN
jgi:hypothetical protein